MSKNQNAKWLKAIIKTSIKSHFISLCNFSSFSLIDIKIKMHWL